MTRALITGFVPFHIFPKNPSQAVADALSGRSDIDIKALILPVEYGKARETLLSAMEDLKPEMVVSFGLNGKISHIALEEIAVNIRGSDRPDNIGRLLSGDPVVEGGALAYRSNLPIAEILRALRSQNIPARVSYSAGIYLCNEVFYTAMEWCEKNGAAGGFVHIPMATEYIPDDPELISMPHMSLADIQRAADLIVEVSAALR